jgi:hypothetical protein
MCQGLSHGLGKAAQKPEIFHQQGGAQDMALYFDDNITGCLQWDVFGVRSFQS